MLEAAECVYACVWGSNSAYVRLSSQLISECTVSVYLNACVCHLLCPVIRGLCSTQWCSLWIICLVSTKFSLFSNMFKFLLIHFPYSPHKWSIFSVGLHSLSFIEITLWNSFCQRLPCSFTISTPCWGLGGGLSLEGCVRSEGPGQSQLNLSHVSTMLVPDLASHSLPLSISLFCTTAHCQCGGGKWRDWYCFAMLWQSW